MKGSHKIAIKIVTLFVIFAASHALLFITLFLFLNYILFPSSLVIEGVTYSTVIIAAFIFVFLLMVEVLIGFKLIDQLFRPIEEIQKGSRFLSLGYFDYRINNRTGDEMEELSNSFNMMASSLGDAFNKLRNDNIVISSERNKLQVTIAAISDAIIVTDLDRKIVIFNNAAAKLTGYQAKDVLSKPIDNVIQIFSNRRKLSPEEYCPVGNDNYTGIVFSKEGVQVNGLHSTKYADIITSKIAQSEKINLGSIIVLKDISEQMELEQMKLDFVSMAAHELRTPVSIMRDYLYLIRHNYGSTLNNEVNDLLSVVNSSVLRLANLIEQLLNVSGIERRTNTLERQQIDWQEIIQNGINQIKDLAKSKNIILSSNLDSPILINVDKQKMQVVLNNLLENAVSHTPPGGEIDILIDKKETEVITHVKDTGPGIPEEDLPHLFTKFFRITKRLMQYNNGLGLGLYTAKSIIDMHNGRIWVESIVGKGSTFSFSLPLSPASPTKISL